MKAKVDGAVENKTFSPQELPPLKVLSRESSGLLCVCAALEICAQGRPKCSAVCYAGAGPVLMACCSPKVETNMVLKLHRPQSWDSWWGHRLPAVLSASSSWHGLVCQHQATAQPA